MGCAVVASALGTPRTRAVTASAYSIGRLLFDPASGTLGCETGAQTCLRPKTAQVLRHLAERGGQVVSRDELIEAVWPGVFVTENGLTQCVAEIRRALGPDDALLRTLPRRGYVLDVPSPDAARGPDAAARPATAGGRSGIPVLAVLPFRLAPPVPGLAVFADILLDSLVGALASLREPVVISANSTRHLAGLAEAVPPLARRLGADYLVSGALYPMGERVRLSLELAEASQGAVVWHHGHDLTEAMLFQAPEQLAAVVAHTLVPRLRQAELQKARRRRHDLGSYHLVLEAQSLMFRFEPGGFEAAREMLRQAAALDPGFAGPHAALGDWHSLRIGQNWSPDPAADSRALEAETRLAIELDAGHPRALALLGHSHTILRREYGTAQDLLLRALEAAPNDAEARMWASPTLAYTGRAEEAVRNAERAIALSPEDPLLFRYQHFLAIAHYANGAFEEAAQWGLRSMRANRDYTSNLGLTAAALGALGRTEEARPVAERLLQLRPGYSVVTTTSRNPFRDEAARERFGRHLEAAGLPR